MNKRAKKLIKNIFFNKKDGQYIVIKDHIVELFSDKKLIFDNPSHLNEIVLNRQSCNKQSCDKGQSLMFN